jgi:hypothetical protein
MAQPTVTEISSFGDVDFDQDVDTETVIASSGGIAVNGDAEDSAFNSGLNKGILAGDDVTLDDSIVGDGNTQLNDSTVGAFAARGNATNAVGENVLLGSGDLVDIDSEGDAQAVTGNGNEVTGDVTFDLHNVDGPMNFAVGDANRQNALEDNSSTVEDSYNQDHSIEDSYNTSYQDSYNTLSEDNDSHTSTVEDSYNTLHEDNDTTTWDWASESSYESHSEDNDTFEASLDLEHTELDLWGDDNDIELDA